MVESQGRQVWTVGDLAAHDPNASQGLENLLCMATTQRVVERLRAPDEQT